MSRTTGRRQHRHAEAIRLSAEYERALERGDHMRAYELQQDLDAALDNSHDYEDGDE